MVVFKDEEIIMLTKRDLVKLENLFDKSFARVEKALEKLDIILARMDRFQEANELYSEGIRVLLRKQRDLEQRIEGLEKLLDESLEN